MTILYIYIYSYQLCLYKCHNTHIIYPYTLSFYSYINIYYIGNAYKLIITSNKLYICEYYIWLVRCAFTLRLDLAWIWTDFNSRYTRINSYFQLNCIHSNWVASTLATAGLINARFTPQASPSTPFELELIELIKPDQPSHPLHLVDARLKPQTPFRNLLHSNWN